MNACICHIYIWGHTITSVPVDISIGDSYFQYQKANFYIKNICLLLLPDLIRIMLCHSQSCAQYTVLMFIHLLQVMKECFRELKALQTGEKGLGAGDAEEDEEEDAGE